MAEHLLPGPARIGMRALRGADTTEPVAAGALRRVQVQSPLSPSEPPRAPSYMDPNAPKADIAPLEPRNGPTPRGLTVRPPAEARGVRVSLPQQYGAEASPRIVPEFSPTYSDLPSGRI